MTEKVCTKCGRTKPEDEFRCQRGKPSQPCLDCHRRANAEWRAANPEKMRAAQERFAAEHVEYNRARGRKRYAEHKEHMRAVQKLYAAKHREERRAWKHQYDLEHQAEHREYNRKRRVAVPAVAERKRQQTKAWAQANPQRLRALNREAGARRRARQSGARINDFTQAQWEWLLEQYQHRCSYCGKHSRRLQQDHVIPLAKGGDHTLRNIVPACPTCNQKKKDRTLEVAGMRYAIRVPV